MRNRFNTLRKSNQTTAIMNLNRREIRRLAKMDLKKHNLYMNI